MKTTRKSKGPLGSVRTTASVIMSLCGLCAGAAGADAPANTAADGPSAQPSKDDALTEIVVTGYRSSLQQAIDLKKNFDIEEDSILAEDIGKFPDQNLAESLQRIPGVAVTREEGEGREITVRGLGPQYTRVRINGMEALTTTGGPDNEGGVNRTRDFDFNIFSSDLFNSITVRKTAEASVDEGSIGATVDLHTAHPLDYGKFVLITQAKGNYNDLSGTVGPQFSGLISDTFADGTLGALASVSFAKRSYLDTGASTVRWDEAQVLKTGTTPLGASPYGFASVLGTPCTGTAATLPAVCQQADGALHPRFPRYDYFQDTESRQGDSVSLAVETQRRESVVARCVALLLRRDAPGAISRGARPVGTGQLHQPEYLDQHRLHQRTLRYHQQPGCDDFGHLQRRRYARRGPVRQLAHGFQSSDLERQTYFEPKMEHR